MWSQVTSGLAMATLALIAVLRSISLNTAPPLLPVPRLYEVTYWYDLVLSVPTKPADALNFNRSIQLNLFLMKGSSDASQPIEADGKPPQLLPGANLVLPSAR